MELSLTRVLLLAAIAVAGFGAAFAIGQATAGSSSGGAGVQRLQVFDGSAEIPDLDRAQSLPPMAAAG